MSRATPVPQTFLDSIDVVFILLVVFTLATSFTDWRPVALATGAGAPGAHNKPPAVVRVGPNGALGYRGRGYGVKDLAAKLVAARGRGAIAAVVVAPAAATPLAATVYALDTLRGAGVRIALAPNPGPPQAKKTAAGKTRSESKPAAPRPGSKAQAKPKPTSAPKPRSTPKPEPKPKPRPKPKPLIERGLRLDSEPVHDPHGTALRPAR